MKNRRENIFIEGTQGSGKTTLLRQLAQKLPEYHMYWEGDLSPVELAWCRYMTESEYENALERFPEQAEEIRRNTAIENERRIVSYTRILADNREFYSYMEQFEIYNGRKTLEEFRRIILQRFSMFRETGALFECSLFQNIMEELILFYQLSKEEILFFYRELFEKLDLNHCLLIYLDSEDFETNIEQIRKERVDLQGNELWYDMMIQYLNHSPYGSVHPFLGTADMAAHFQRRRDMEMMVIQELMGKNAIIVKAKQFELVNLIQQIREINNP